MVEWKPCPGHEQTHEVSDEGDVRRITDSNRASAGYLLKLWMLGPYLVVKVNGQRRFVHRLVCEAFNGSPPPGLPFALHRNDKKWENVPANLYWGSTQDNANDRRVNEGYAANRGERSKVAVLTEDLVRQIRALKGTMSERKMAAHLGVNRGNIQSVLSGRAWGHVDG